MTHLSQITLHKWLLFSSISLLLFLMNFDMTAVNLALAPIAVDLHLSIINVQWLVSAYLVGGASLVMLGGLLGDLYGHKKIFLLGTVVFTLASLGVALSTSIWPMISMRLFQGFGAALAWPLAIVIVRKAFTNNEGLAMGLIAGVMGGSMSIGPPLGGLILHVLGWRWIFFINVPLGLGVLLAGVLCIPKDNMDQTVGRVHLPSAGLLVGGLLLFIFGLTEAQHLGIQSTLILITLFGGVSLIGIFIYLQAIVKDPLIDLELFKNKALTSCFLVRFFWQVLWMSIFLILSLLLQNVLGYSVLHASLFFLVATATFAIIAPFGGKLAEIYSPRRLIIIALLFYVAMFASFSWITNTAPAWKIGIIFSLLGIGSGIGFPSLLNVTLALVPANRRGMASGFLYACLFSGGCVGAIFVGSCIGWIAPKILQHKLQHLGLNLSQSLNETLMHAATGVRNIYNLSHTFDLHQAKLLIALVQQSFLQAFSIIMLICIVIAIMTVCMAWFIRSNSR